MENLTIGEKRRAPGRWRKALRLAALAAPLAGLACLAQRPAIRQAPPKGEAMQTGKFSPDWKSLEQYQTPDWFRDAKFGIWAHWGPQCAPEAGDWYARHMYMQGEKQYEDHLRRYGHPSKSGFKEVIRDWKAENWNPDELMALYKRAGAQFFVAMANHHDNFDLWDSKYQPWNSVALGPRKDIVAGWAAAARRQGLRFGVSVHAAHAWMWYDTSQMADKTGPLAGAPYDGKLTKADGKGTWWEGLDPQDLYAQNHAPCATGNVWVTWDWNPKYHPDLPDKAYCEKFYNRTADLINQCRPDLVYYDDTVLPLWPASDVGLRLAAHFYNSNMQWHGGRLDAVMLGKILNKQQRRCLVWDVERGATSGIEPLPWEADTCLGGWHYDRAIYERHGYKPASEVIRKLADVTSKNGTLLMSVPVRADGTIDADERRIVEEIGAWLGVNGEAIFGTRPWKVFGEGPSAESFVAMENAGFNEGKLKPLTAADVRFTAKGDAVYAIVCGVPAAPLAIKTLGRNAGLLKGEPARIELLGSAEPVKWSRDGAALTIQPPAAAPRGEALAYKITPAL